jgi:hypothetical protein
VEWRGVTLVDLPGYDTARFPKEVYFKQFEVPSYDLFLCVFSGKLREADSQFFKELKSAGKVCLFVRNKSDDLWQRGKTVEELRAPIVRDVQEHSGDASQKVYFTSCKTPEGIDKLEKAIHDNLSAAKAERWARSAKASSKEFLDLKRAACERYVTLASGASAANALNPISGVDIAVDVSVLVVLFKEIRDAYGLTENRLHDLAAGPLSAIAKEVGEFATKQGILMLLKRFAGREVVKSVAKYIPFVGQLVAAAIGFGVTKSAGDWYLESCHQLAEETLSNELRAGQ